MTPDFSFKLTYLMTISLVLSSIPNMLSMIRLPIYNWAALTCFRILSRSFSGVVRFHNEQFRPKSDGICVANHTTPIDVVVLSCDRSYALVTKLEIASGTATQSNSGPTLRELSPICMKWFLSLLRAELVVRETENIAFELFSVLL